MSADQSGFATKSPIQVRDRHQRRPSLLRHLQHFIDGDSHQVGRRDRQVRVPQLYNRTLGVLG